MEPKLKAFLVSTQWSDGVGSLGVFVEYTPEMAGASAVVGALRGTPEPTGSLTNLLVREVEPAFLRAILTQLETGRPSADVVKLVPQEPAPEEPPAPPQPDDDRGPSFTPGEPAA